MDNASSVLVTGTAGRVGQAACQALLARGHQVRAFDIRKSPGVDDARIGDISDLSQISNAMSQIDVVVHLAATPDDDDSMNKLLPNNIVGTYNVLESARQANVARVILASTGQVVMGHDGPWPITPEMPFSPRNWYASAKVMAEVAGQFYARVHGLSVIVARLGWCPRDKRHANELAGDEFRSRLDRISAWLIIKHFADFQPNFRLFPNVGHRFEGAEIDVRLDHVIGMALVTVFCEQGSNRLLIILLFVTGKPTQ